MRYVMYSLLSGEGSLQSQLVSLQLQIPVAQRKNDTINLHSIETTGSSSRG